MIFKGLNGRDVDLTEREVEAASLIAAGLRRKEVANAMNLSIKTVEKHVATLYEKLGVNDVASLTHFALARGLTKNMFTP